MQAVKVFKFGGASVCDADSIRNVGRVLQLFAPEKLVIVVSAMGKTTNAIEQMAGKAYAGLPWEAYMQQLAESHLQTAHELNLDKQTIERLIANLRSNLVNYKDLPFDQYYDQTVPFGELLSSALLSAWLQANGQPTTLLAAGDLLVTDKTWREATVDMEASIMAIQKQVIPALANGHVLTQGFIGKYSSAFYTTLGREGSDYT
ncbi:MAG TPA: aspartate kinase, partial [Bacteroidetes bacterium]|nr:aspartate kinase [Bacteroidota bacterium]